MHPRPRSWLALALVLALAVVIGWLVRPAADPDLALPARPAPAPVADPLAMASSRRAPVDEPAASAPAPAPASRPGTSRLTGRIVDTEGNARADVQVVFLRQGRPPAREAVTSDASGGFTVAAMPAGEWRVAIDTDALLLRPELFSIDSEGERFVELVVATEDAAVQIQGRVRDERGQPVVDARVAALAIGGGFAGLGRTRGDGTFVVRRKVKNDAVDLHVSAAGFESLDDPRRLTWGTRDVELQLRHCPRLLLTVVAAEGRQPVEELEVCVVPRADVEDPRPVRPPRAVRKHGRFAGGVVPIEVAALGPQRVMVRPRDERLALTDWLAVEVPGAEATATVEVPLAAELQVTVVTGDGVPVAGSRVELLRHEVDRPWTLATPVVTFARLQGGLVRTAEAISLWTADTDAAGRAVLRAAPSGRPLGVRVVGAGHVPILVTPVAFTSAGATLRITVVRGATLAGVLEPMSVVNALAAAGEDEPATGPGPDLDLRLLRAGAGEPATFPLAGALLVGADGRFEWPAVPPGSWLLQLRWSRVERDGSRVRTGQRQLLQIDDLSEGERRELRIDVSSHRPGSLAGTVRVDGQPLVRGRITLSGTSEAAGAARARDQVSFRTDDAGGFVVRALPAGDYQLRVETIDAASGAAILLHAREAIHVAPGAVLERAFDVRHQRLYLRLVDAGAGRPLAGHLAVLNTGDSARRFERTTDAEGWIVFDPAPPDRVTVRALRVGVTPEEWRAAPAAGSELLADLGSCEAAAGEAETRVTLRVPAR